MLATKYYAALVEMLGESSDLDEFKEKLITFLRIDSETFDETRFREVLQKIQQTRKRR